MENNDILNCIDNDQFKQFFIENTNDVFWVLDENKKVVFVSPSIFELTGYSPEEYIRLGFLNKFSNNSAQKLNSLFEKIELMTEFKNLYIEYIAKSGEAVLTEVSGKVLRDNQGNFKGVYGLTVNMTDKYKLQNELTAEKAKNLEAQKFKSIILGIMGHEFRTPLSGILGFTKVLSKSLKSSDEQEMLGYIYQSAQRLNATLNSIVTLAALESNQMEVKQEEIDLLEVIQSVYQSFEPIIISKNISFDVNIKNQNSHINFDENCFYQILYHLIDNAIKFTEKGKVFLDISIGSNGIGKYLEVNVEDTGIGIKKHKFDTIFEPFRQLSEGHNRKFEGLGIGLTTTKKLVEKLNGTISLKSKLNEGSKFTIRLPIFES